MKPRVIYTILGTTIGSVIILVILNFSVHNPNAGDTGFTRVFIEGEAIKVYEVNIGETATDIAGTTEEAIYLMTEDPHRLLEYSKRKRSITPIRLDYPDYDKLKTNFSIKINYPNAYVIASNVPGIIQYDLETDEYRIRRLERVFSRDAALFDGNMVIREFDSTMVDQQLRKINLSTGVSIISNKVVERRGDAGFSTAGMLNFDTTARKLVYVHLYSNRIYFMDPDLNLLKEGKTIDTCYSYQAKATGHMVNGKPSFSHAVPPRKVNATYTFCDGRLYVLSMVRSANQTMQEYGDNHTIDIYDTGNANYLGSIYLPKESGLMNRFLIANGKQTITLLSYLVGIMEKYLKPDQYYIDEYDRMTIGKLKELEKDKAVTEDELNFEARTLNKTKPTVIAEMKRSDAWKDDMVELHAAPTGIKCNTCKRKMDFDSHYFRGSGTDMEMRFLFECPYCDGKRKVTDTNGREVKTPKITCPVCGSEDLTKKKKVADYIITFTDTCRKCGHKEVMELDDTPDEPINEEDRHKYCTQFDIDARYWEDLNNLLDVVGRIVNNPHKDEELEVDPDVVKKKTIAQAEKFIAKQLSGFEYTRFRFGEPQIGRKIVVPFTVWDDTERGKSKSISELKKAIVAHLFPTNWRLVQSSVTFRMGLLKGRVHGYDENVDILKIAKEVALSKQRRKRQSTK